MYPTQLSKFLHLSAFGRCGRPRASFWQSWASKPDDACSNNRVLGTRVCQFCAARVFDNGGDVNVEEGATRLFLSGVFRKLWINTFPVVSTLREKDLPQPCA